MSCIYCLLTDKSWKNCHCGGVVAHCVNPARQHPNVPPLDHAGLHSERVVDKEGNIDNNYTRVNSVYCTRRACKSYTETINDETCDLRDLQGRDRKR